MRNVLVDPARLEQIAWNLLNNAIKFTPPEGTITLRSRNSPDHPVLIIEIADTGMGIDPGRLSSIFEAFDQGSMESMHHHGGLGLGLAICKVLVEMHGGSIYAESEGPGRGARFTVKLPITMEPQTQHPRVHSSEMRPLRILLVEDHAGTARAMTRLLQCEGHHVHCCESFASAVEAVEHDGFDLLLSDLGLPDGDGAALLGRLRQRMPELVGIAVSGHGMVEDRQHSERGGYSRHLVKPVSIEQLRAAMGQAVCELRRNRGE
jgi:CheY-like chemotaxis protein